MKRFRVFIHYLHCDNNCFNDKDSFLGIINDCLVLLCQIKIIWKISRRKSAENTDKLKKNQRNQRKSAANFLVFKFLS